MKKLNIFRAGTHVAMSGETITFSEADLQGMVAAYNPEKHEAPIVVGHPKDNAPAYGWISRLSLSEQGVEAETKQVDEAFAELVQAGRYKKKSASFYPPDSKNNPVPGSYYLRHVGFLGATPPAIKGLRDVEFADADDAVVLEFDEEPQQGVSFAGWWAFDIVANTFRNLREFIIEKYSREDAERVFSNYSIDAIKEAATKVAASSTAAVAYNEKGDDTMDDATKELQAKLEAQAKALADAEADFAERAKKLEEKERRNRKEQYELRLDKLIQAGKVLPAQKGLLIALCESQGADQMVAFGEAEQKKPAVDVLFAFLETMPKLVDYGESAASDSVLPMNDPQALSTRIREYVNEEAKKGNSVSYAEAAEHVGRVK